jgi:putative FmdB family regulatory protein
MPAYEYVCSKCGSKEIRITGINDHKVFCDKCEGEMFRHVDPESLLASYATSQVNAQ